MKHFSKTSRFAALFLAVAIVMSSLFVASANQAKAAETDADYDVLLREAASATAGNIESYAFNIAHSTLVEIGIYVPAPVGMAVQITPVASQANAYTETVTSNPADWDYDATLGLYCYELSQRGPVTGDYNFSFVFDADTEYMTLVLLDKPSASISNKSIILTKGFSQKLSVSNGTVSKWSSSKASVAAVDKNGKVTAKATGTATITATTTDGQTLTCSVQVKANAYKHAKMSFSSAQYGNAYISITNISYNKKGDVVIKGSYLNNCGHKIVKLSNINIKVKNKSGKIIGTYTAKSQKISIPHGGSKSFSYTIKKAKLKQKSTQDLRQSSVTPTWKYYRSAL